MLKLSLKPGEYITLGDNIKIIFSGGSANNIHLLVDAPREINVARNSAGKDKKPSPYYKEKGISKTAQREIAEILMHEKRNQSHVSGEETVTYKNGNKQGDPGGFAYYKFQINLWFVWQDAGDHITFRRNGFRGTHTWR